MLRLRRRGQRRSAYGSLRWVVAASLVGNEWQASRFEALVGLRELREQ